MPHPLLERRAFIKAWTRAAVLLPATAYAAPPAKPSRRVGLLMSTDPVAAAHIMGAFADSLRERGYSEGKDVVLRKSLSLSPAACMPSVSTMPGLMAFTRIRRGPSSFAKDRVTASAAALVAL
jgi:hypothetical protein